MSTGEGEVLANFKLRVCSIENQYTPLHERRGGRVGGNNIFVRDWARRRYSGHSRNLRRRWICKFWNSLTTGMLVLECRACNQSLTLRYRSEFNQPPISSSLWRLYPNFVNPIRGVCPNFNAISAGFKPCIALAGAKIKVVSIQSLMPSSKYHPQ
jgi:hypothetical protein